MRGTSGSNFTMSVFIQLVNDLGQIVSRVGVPTTDTTRPIIDGIQLPQNCSDLSARLPQDIIDGNVMPQVSVPSGSIVRTDGCGWLSADAVTVFSGGSDADRACLEYAQVDCHTDPSIIAGIAFGAFLLLIMMVGLVIHARVSSGDSGYHAMDSLATGDPMVMTPAYMRLMPWAMMNRSCCTREEMVTGMMSRLSQQPSKPLF